LLIAGAEDGDTLVAVGERVGEPLEDDAARSAAA